MSRPWLLAAGGAAVVVVIVAALVLSRGGEDAKPTAEAPDEAPATSATEATTAAAEQEPAAGGQDSEESSQSAAAETENESSSTPTIETSEADTPGEQAASAEQETAPAVGSDGNATATAELASGTRDQEQLAALPSDETTGVPQPPSFDVVRVEGSGETVVAGRAEPHSTITLLDGDVEFGTVVADQNGNWVLLPNQALAPGNHELTLRALTPDGRVSESADAVIVVVPKAPRAVAKAAPSDAAGDASQTTELQTAPEAETAAEPGQALAVLVPRSGTGASQVLQGPDDAGLQDRDLVLSAVDYDENGRIIISGHATPGARVLAFLDDRPIGEAEVNESGRWVISPSEPVATGLHHMRIDQVDASGAVVASIETPFSRAAMLTNLPGERFFVVQPGHSLWRIARRTYGHGLHFTLIYGSNQHQIGHPDLIYPGQVFILPENQ